VWSLIANRNYLEVNAGHSGDRCIARLWLDQPRSDAWWVAPVVVFLGLGTFVGYSTWAAFQTPITRSARTCRVLRAGAVASPGDTAGLEQRGLASKPAWIPAFLPFSPRC